METLKDDIKNIKDWLIKIRRDIHLTPELGLEEFITNKKIKKYLDEIKIPYKTFNHTGIVAYINNNAKTTIAIRCDIDALPIEEKNDTSYKSIFKGKMHACGHDAHTAILLGTCKILYSIKDKLNVNVKFFFQPAEETVGGAKLLINDGCMENPKVDYTFGLHVAPHLDTGFVELKYGTMNASTDDIFIKIKGKKSHGAYPHQGIDAIVCASYVITTIQTLVSRNTSPNDSIVISFGIIEGGVKENIVCDEVIIKGTLRTLNNTTRNFVKKRIKEITENTCKSFGAFCDIKITEGYEPLINDTCVVNLIKANCEKILGKEKVIIKNEPSLGAEDFSFYLNHSKGAFYHIGCKNPNTNITYNLHTDAFDIDEDCLIIGVLVHVVNVLSFQN